MPGPLDEHDDPCCWSYHMQGNDGTEGILRYGCSNHHRSTSVLHCRKTVVRVARFYGLPPHMNSPCSWKKRKTGLVGWSTYQPLWSLHHFNPFWLLIVDYRGLVVATFPWYPALLSSRRTDLVETGLSRYRFNSAVTLAAVVWCLHLTMRYNALRSFSLSLKVRPELLQLLEIFTCLLNSVMIYDVVAVQLFWWRRLLPYERQQFAIFQTQSCHAFYRKF